MADDIGLAQLTRLIRDARPDSLAAALSGSFLARPRHLVSDIDVIALVPMGAGEKEIIGSYTGLRVECTRYDPQFPSAVHGASLPPLLMLREFRKLCVGRVLFGAPIIRSCCDMICNLEIAKKDLEQIADIATSSLEYVLPKEAAFVCLIKALEAVLFLNGCLYRWDGPSKPKWYFLDGVESPIGAIREAVQSIVSVPQLARADEFARLVEVVGTIRAEAPLSTMKKDLITLDRAGETAAARMLLMVILSRLQADQMKAEVALPEYFCASAIFCAEWYQRSRLNLLEALWSLKCLIESANRIPVAHPYRGLAEMHHGNK